MQIVVRLYVGVALTALLKYDDAIEFFNDGLKLSPRDENLNTGLAKVTSFEKSLVSVAFAYTNTIH